MTSTLWRRNRSLAIGVVFAFATAAYLALGNAVSHVPPAGIDAAARVLAGEAPSVAWVFTASCLWPVLTVYGVAGCIIAARLRVWRGRIVFAIVMTLATWQTSNVLKDVFARPRPDYWIVHHETTFSYSSGHAMFALVVYWLWAYHAARGTMNPALRVPLCLLLLAWGAGIIWSRLALGAHYPTDLAGGLLLGIAMLTLGSGLALVIAPRSRFL